MLKPQLKSFQNQVVAFKILLIAMLFLIQSSCRYISWDFALSRFNYDENWKVIDKFGAI